MNEESRIQELEKRVTHAEDLAKRSFKMIMIGGIVYLITIAIFGWMYVNSVVATSEISKNDKNQEQMLNYIEKRVSTIEEKLN